MHQHLGIFFFHKKNEQFIGWFCLFLICIYWERGKISSIRIVLKICRITIFINSKFPRFCIDWYWFGPDHRCVAHTRKEWGVSVWRGARGRLWERNWNELYPPDISLARPGQSMARGPNQREPTLARLGKSIGRIDYLARRWLLSLQRDVWICGQIFRTYLSCKT